MPLDRRDKENIVTAIKPIAQNALSAIVIDYRGTNVKKMTQFRDSCRENGVKVKVIKNTLLRKIVEKTPLACLKDAFIGPSLIAFSNDPDYPSAAAKLCHDFAKEQNREKPVFNIKAAAFDGQLFTSSEQFSYLANIPSRKEILSLLLFALKEASIGRLARVIDAVAKKNGQDPVKIAE